MQKFLFSAVSSLSLCAAIYFSFFVVTPNYAMTGIWLTFSIFTFAFGWSEIAESISFFGNNIQLRKVQATLNEAEEIIASLKTFAAALAEHSITDLMAGCFGFQGGMGRYKRFELKEKIIQTLKKMGFSDNEIEEVEVMSQWKKGVCMIYWNAISHALEKRTERNQVNFNEPERRKISEALSTRMKGDANDFTDWDVPVAEEIEKLIVKEGITIDKPLQSWLDDYKNYLSTGKIGRPDDLLKGNY